MNTPEQIQSAVEHLTSNLQNPKYYGPRETASLRTILDALEAAQLELVRAQRWIIDHRQQHMIDHACQYCVGHDTGNDFICVYHTAETALDAALQKAT